MDVFGRIDVPLIILMSTSILHGADPQSKADSEHNTRHPVESLLTFSASSVSVDFTISMTKIPEPEQDLVISYHDLSRLALFSGHIP